MCDDGMLDRYLHEADRHIHGAEAMLCDLTQAGSTPMRQLRAAMYIRAMRRLRSLIATYRSLPWNQAAPPAPAAPGWNPLWPLHWPGRGIAKVTELDRRDG
jgi:hypothetical protein